MDWLLSILQSPPVLIVGAVLMLIGLSSFSEDVRRWIPVLRRLQNPEWQRWTALFAGLLLFLGTDPSPTTSVVFVASVAVVAVALNVVVPRLEKRFNKKEPGSKTKPAPTPAYESRHENKPDGRIELVLQSSSRQSQPAWWECKVSDLEHDWVSYVTVRVQVTRKAAQGQVRVVFPDDFDEALPGLVPPGWYRVEWTQTQRMDPSKPETVALLGKHDFQVTRTLQHDDSKLWRTSSQYLVDSVYGEGVLLKLDGPLEDQLGSFSCRVERDDGVIAFAEESASLTHDPTRSSDHSQFHFPGEFKFTAEPEQELGPGKYRVLWNAVSVDPDGIGIEGTRDPVQYTTFTITPDGQFVE